MVCRVSVGHCGLSCVCRSPLKQHLKKQQKCDWLNSPNAYKREEYDEINTATPKKYTRVRQHLLETLVVIVVQPPFRDTSCNGSTAPSSTAPI